MGSPAESGASRRDSFIDYDSIQIVGAKQDAAGRTREADVLFSDLTGKVYYVTVTSGEEFVADAIRKRYAAEMGDEDSCPIDTTPDPPKFIWNDGELRDQDIKCMIDAVGFELLTPFLVEVIDEV